MKRIFSTAANSLGITCWFRKSFETVRSNDNSPSEASASERQRAESQWQERQDFQAENFTAPTIVVFRGISISASGGFSNSSVVECSMEWGPIKAKFSWSDAIK